MSYVLSLASQSVRHARNFLSLTPRGIEERQFTVERPPFGFLVDRHLEREGFNA